MEKRTAKEIERDYKIIRKYVDCNPSVLSFEQIANGTNLTVSKIHTSLSKHPKIFKEIKTIISKNKELNETSKKNLFTSKKKKDITKYVIDASITGIESLRDILNEILDTKSKIVLTNVTTKELNKMQQSSNIKGKDARYILNLVADNPESSESVLIDETLATPNDCIIKYCFDNKDNIILLTSNKNMAINARAYGVETHYFKQEKKIPVITDSSKMRVMTLYPTKRINGELSITNFGNDLKQILVISNGIEIKKGIHKLNLGDDVYVTTKKPEYLTFAHYKIISLNDKNNCNLVYSKRFYHEDQINLLPKASYKSFMRNFTQIVKP